MRITKATKTDVKASSDIRFNDYCNFVYQNSKLSREDAKDICVDCWNQGKSKEEALEIANTSSTKTDVKASSNYNLWSEGQLRSKMFEIGFNPNGLSKAEMIADLEQYDADISKESTDASSCNASTSTDKALQHIKAAIDILGTSGDKSDVTKDSIANLSVVMFDLKSKQ